MQDSLRSFGGPRWLAVGAAGYQQTPGRGTP